MIFSDPPSPSSPEGAAPRSGTLTPAEREKKPDKKLETPVLVAIISAVVTLVSSILGSPVLLAQFNRASSPAATPTVALVITQNSFLPGTPPASEFPKATFTPPESGIDNPKFTSTPQLGNPTSAPSVLTATLAPPQKPDLSTPTAASFLQCMAADRWFPYPALSNPVLHNGCLDLTDWGFSTDQGRLVLAPSLNQDQQRGIYLPISGDVDIRFSVQLDKFRTRFNKVGFLNFGIVQNDPLSIYTGGFLSYQQPTPGTSSPVHVLISGRNQATQKISVLDAGFQHEVLLSIKGDQLKVYLNGEQTGNPVNLPPTDRAFWIGYVLPSKSDLKVAITNLTIQANK